MRSDPVIDYERRRDPLPGGHQVAGTRLPRLCLLALALDATVLLCIGLIDSFAYNDLRTDLVLISRCLGIAASALFLGWTVTGPGGSRRTWLAAGACCGVAIVLAW